jgi:hypothetical protein
MTREAHTPETCAVIDELMIQHKDRVVRIGAGPLDALLKVNTILYAEGKPALLANHRTRLKTIRLHMKMMKIIGAIRTSASAAPHAAVRFFVCSSPLAEYTISSI